MTEDVLAFQLRSVECGSGAVPDPDRLAVAGELVAVLTKETDPVAAPLAAGANVTVTCFVVPAAIATGSVNPETLNPVPVTFAALTVTELVPVFESVTVALVLLPTTTLPNETLVGETLSRAVGAAVAVPDSETVGGVFGALLLMVRLPVKLATVAGANRTVNVVACPAGTEIGNVAPTRLNEVPVTVALVRDIAAPPVFDTCTIRLLVLLTTILPKFKVVGVTAI